MNVIGSSSRLGSLMFWVIITTDTTLSIESHRLLLGILQWLGSSFGADLPENIPMEAIVHMKVALSLEQRVTSMTGLNTTKKQDSVDVNTEIILTARYHSKLYLQILNIFPSHASYTTPALGRSAGPLVLLFSCVGALNTPGSSCS